MRSLSNLLGTRVSQQIIASTFGTTILKALFCFCSVNNLFLKGVLENLTAGQFKLIFSFIYMNFRYPALKNMELGLNNYSFFFPCVIKHFLKFMIEILSCSKVNWL